LFAPPPVGLAQLRGFVGTVEFINKIHAKKKWFEGGVDPETCRKIDPHLTNAIRQMEELREEVLNTAESSGAISLSPTRASREADAESSESQIRPARPAKYTQPLFALECGPDVPGSEKPALWAGGPEGLPVKFLRVVVHIAGRESVSNCTGYLTEIRKNHEKRWEGDNAKLTFAPGEDPDALSKTIHERVPEFLDVLAITSRNQLFVGTKGRGWPYMPRLHDIFSEPGNYLLSICITGDGLPTAAPQLTFTWTQNWETSQLRL
jgi:hypothetical protein